MGTRRTGVLAVGEMDAVSVAQEGTGMTVEATPVPESGPLLLAAEEHLRSSNKSGKETCAGARIADEIGQTEKSGMGLS